MKRAPKNTPILSAEKLTARKEQSVLEQWAQNRLRDVDKLTPFERDVLIKHKLIDGEPDGAKEDAAPLPNVTTQRELAVALDRAMRGRFKYEINPVLISDWKQGKRLPQGCPLPPAKEGHFFVTTQWAKWMEDFILVDPRFGIHATGDAKVDIYEQGAIAKVEAQILDRDLRRLEFEKAQARYVTVEVARVTRRGALKLQHVMMRRVLENDHTQRRMDWLEQKLAPADLLAFREFDGTLARSLIDELEREYKRHASAEPEKEQARQLADSMVRG